MIQYFLIVATVATVAVIYISSQRESFRVIGTNINGEEEQQTYKPPKVEKLKRTPTAPEMSHRYHTTHRTPISNYKQISNHRRPNEYSTMENGTAKPFEMNSENFYECNPTQQFERTREMNIPLSQEGHIRVGSFAQQLQM